MQQNNHIVDKLKEFEKNDAIVWHNCKMNYQELIPQVQQWKSFLIKEHIASGECIAFCSDFSPASTALLIALIENKNIIVPLTPTLQHNMQWYIDIAHASKLIEFNQEEKWQLHHFPNKQPHILF